MAIDSLTSRLQSFHNYSLDKRAIPMAQVSALVELMEQKGFSAQESLQGTGIVPAEGGRVTYRQRIAQLQRMLALLNSDGSWFGSTRSPSISDYGLLGYAMMSSATLRQAVEIAVKYHRMAGAMFELKFMVNERDAVLRIEHLLPSGNVARYVVEEQFIGIMRLIGLLIGQPHSPTCIVLNYPAPEYQPHEECFGCSVEFDQPYCEYRFDKSLLDQPLAEADANTAKICEESCRQLLNQMDIEEDIISKICHLLLSTPGEFPKLDSVAQRLSLGARTLRRRLHELGTSYQQILDDVRRQLAMEYLQTTNLTLQEIAELLGYSEVTNFRRAFMRWADLSPYQFRKQTAVMA